MATRKKGSRKGGAVRPKVRTVPAVVPPSTQIGDLLDDVTDRDLEAILWQRFGDGRSPGLSFEGVRAFTPLLRETATHVPITEIHDLEALAEAVIGDREEARKWLSEPNLATDNRAPILLAGSPEGYERVRNLLLRIEFGVLA